jgi:alanine racemase
MKIATIGIGYADGYRRSFSNKGKVLINGKVCNVIGTVCMDSCMVDVTELGDNVHVGDVAYIWENENIKLEDLANIDNTINYEIISGISDRVRREFI